MKVVKNFSNELKFNLHKQQKVIESMNGTKQFIKNSTHAKPNKTLNVLSCCCKNCTKWIPLWKKKREIIINTKIWNNLLVLFKLYFKNSNFKLSHFQHLLIVMMLSLILKRIEIFNFTVSLIHTRIPQITNLFRALKWKERIGKENGSLRANK